MTRPFHVVIPARLASTRLPGKLMLPLGEKTVISRVYEQAKKAEPTSIIIATDSPIIQQHIESLGAEVIMTSANHVSGTDRIAEVIGLKGFKPDEVIVNVQGDEPFIDPLLIKQVANALYETRASAATLCYPIDSYEQFINPNVVKVVRNHLDEALYFSRAPIPVHRDNPLSIEGTFRHLGLYAYRASLVSAFVNWPIALSESYEALEMLRILYQGHSIVVKKAVVAPMQDINTKEDLDAALAYVASGVE